MLIFISFGAMKKLILLLSVLFVVSCSSSAEEPAPVIKYTLTTAANPTIGGTISPASGQHSEGATVSITASPAAEYLFSSWTGATGTTATASVVMNSNKTVTANFVKKKYALTISVEGEGTVTEKVIKAGAATDYNSGTVVELTATPKDEWVFKEWTGDLTGSDNPKEITIDKAKTVKAVFEEQSPFYLDENGVTIKARDWVTAGTTGELDGVTYTAVDNTTLKEMANKDQDVTKVVTTLVTDMKELFKDKKDFNQDIGDWDVSNVTDMQYLFYDAFDFDQDISSWNTAAVTNMQEMFGGTLAFNQDISSWNTAAVTNMSFMFYNASTFNQDISSWNTAAVTNMSTMFRRARAFNQDISSWNTAAVTDMSGMFYDAFTFDQPIGSWDVSNVTNMGFMFSRSAFNQDIGDWDVSNVTIMQWMFWSNSSFNQDIGSWDVSNVTYLPSMFRKASSFNQDIGNWDVSKVTRWDNMNWMFYGAIVFNQDITKWCVTNLSQEPTDFSNDSALTEANKPIWGTCPGNSYTIAVTASSNTNYTLSGKDRNGDVSGNDPGLTFKVGDEVTFSVNAAGHPFYLKTVAGTGTGNQISGVTNNGTTSGSVVWTPTAAGTYYYQCGPHAEMVGTITIQN